jgi:hypothetical protein
LEVLATDRRCVDHPTRFRIAVDPRSGIGLREQVILFVGRGGCSSPEAVRSGGIQAAAVGTIGGFHLGFRIRLPVSAVSGPSDRARLRLTESAFILSLLNVKAATLRHASKSPLQTAPSGRPATPRLPGFVEVLHLAPAGVMPTELTSLWLVIGAV